MCTSIWCAKRICENAARPRALTRGALTNSCTDKISLELVSGLVRRRGGLSLAAWERDALRRGCGSPSRVPGCRSPPEFGMPSVTARRTAQTFLF